MRNKASDRGALFWTGKYKDQRMTYRTAIYQWDKLCDQAEVKCAIHQLRHTAATELVNSGVSVGTVRRLLGHRNL